jgi:RHS repeat-associated protein
LGRGRLGAEDPGGESAGASGARYGELWDGVTGLVYLRARYYDPALGSFLSR